MNLSTIVTFSLVTETRDNISKYELLYKNVLSVGLILDNHLEINERNFPFMKIHHFNGNFYVVLKNTTEKITNIVTLLLL